MSFSQPAPTLDAPRVVRVGISSCLLGNAVRYDGGHKRDALLTEAFDSRVEWVSVCPEVEAGFGVPREPMRLIEKAGEARLVTIESGRDLTSSMQDFARARLSALARLGLSGYVLKARSPSCGIRDVAVYDGDESVARGPGLFAAMLGQAFPELPIEDEE